VDYEDMSFSLALQNLDATTPISKSSAPCPALTNTDKGLIAVGVVLGVVLAGLLAFAVVWFLGKPRANPRANPTANPITFPVDRPPSSESDDRIEPPG
jgi:hypothetical protein